MPCVLIKILSHASAKKEENKKAEGLQISHFYWSFSRDNVAVKGLNPPSHTEEAIHGIIHQRDNNHIPEQRILKASLQNQHQKESESLVTKPAPEKVARGTSEISLKVNSQDLGKVRL